jgi:hypothetical protein
MVDIYLYPPAIPSHDIILSYGLRSVAVVQPQTPWGGAGWRRRKKIKVPQEEPPVAVSLHDALVDRYGEPTGKEVWSKMLVAREGPFGDGKKYDPKKKRVRKKLSDAGLGGLIE